MAQVVMHTSGQNSPGNETDSIAQIVALSKRRFDGIIMNASHQEVIILEVKRTSDRLPDYWIREHQRVQRQCGDLEKRWIAYYERNVGHNLFVPVVVGTKSINTAEWNKAMTSWFRRSREIEQGNHACRYSSMHMT